MYKAVALTSIAALAGQTMGLNVHRHDHHQVAKRAIETDWTTVWETVYVTVDPGASTAAPAPAAAPTSFGAKDIPSPKASAPAAGNNAGPVPTVTSTSTVVIASSTAAASPSVAASSAAAAPAKDTTTLITAVRPSTVAALDIKLPAASSSVQQSSSEQAASSTPAAPATTETPTPTPTPTPSSSSQAPPPSTTSKAPAPSKAASPPASSGGSPFPSKRGIAYNDGLLANTFGASCDKCGWAYNWGFYPSGIDTSKYSYVPTLWGPSPDHSTGFDAQAEAAIAAGSKALFSFNEPDIASQSNLSPADAASSHAQFMSKYVGKVLIGAPSVSNSGAQGQGLSWLQSFVDACNGIDGCSFDFCNIHWYSPASAIDTLFTQLESAHQVCGGKPVILTEFATTGSSDAETADFLQQALPKLDALDYLMGYSYFMVGTGSLMSSTNALSSFGNIYATE
ncbi:hypothetical protein MKX07_005484 [Trichoderma sp. CBMAI-0711]|uniref:Asl1-like glycosyl hydrolase catalytic domain-containing protein n=1 Tax=Trichoderma parareesei TaxID=858221 RepID=A0A2H2ZHE5_TRIPA|nr:hypothetical protein MKX07_005484 [Trichoderma sp. CBMAI-0711]OTA06837.1 hypothetical protein A9Z42_0076290 [Trichoderma parareesei]